MSVEDTEKIKEIENEIHELEILSENIYNKLKKLRETKLFYELLP